MILITKTYDIVTYESAENGESAESGFVFEDVEYSFRELVDMIERGGFTNSSCYPPKGDTREWLSNEPDTDYVTGDVETESIHYSDKNKPRAAKYWTKAFRAANIIK